MRARFEAAIEHLLDAADIIIAELDELDGCKFREPNLSDDRLGAFGLVMRGSSTMAAKACRLLTPSCLNGVLCSGAPLVVFGILNISQNLAPLRRGSGRDAPPVAKSAS